MQHEPEQKRTLFERLTWLILAASAGIAFLRLYRLPVGDEALLFVQSSLIAEGQVPYRDFFQFIFPGSLYLGAGLIKLFGNSILALRIAALLSLVSASMAMVRLARPCLSRPYLQLLLAFLMAADALLFYFSHHIFSAAAFAWSVYFLARYRQTSSLRAILVCGLMAGLCLVFTQSRGLLLLCGLALYALASLRANHLRDWRPVALGFLTSIVPVLFLIITLMQQNALTAFFQDTVGWFRQGAYSTTTSHLYFADGFIEILNPLMARNADGHSTFNWSGLGYVAFTLLLAWLPVLGLLWGGQLILQKRATPASFRLFWCAGVLLLISTLTYSTGFQIGVTGFFGYLLGFMCLQHWLEPRAGKRVYPFLTLFLAAYMGLNFKNALEIFRNPANWISSYGTAEKHYNLEHGETVGTKYARMTELIQTFSASQAPVFVFNASPELYFLSGRKPATRFLIIYPVYTTEPQRREILESLQKNQPPVIVYDGKMENLHRDFRFKHLPKAKLDLPELWDYLNRHYQYSQQGRYTIMIPLQPAPSGQALR